MKKFLFLAVAAMLATTLQARIYTELRVLKGDEVAYAAEVNQIDSIIFVEVDDTKPGELSGEFSVGAKQTVHFSQGNLQYQASTHTWRFAEHQYDMIGDANSNISDTYDGWIDLFGWGTGDSPTNASSDYDEGYPNYAEWGANAISNGGDEPNVWRSLRRDETEYLFKSRVNADSLFGFGNIAGLNGLIILPDNWETPDSVTFVPSLRLSLEKRSSGDYRNTKGDNYLHNNYTYEQWAIMEAAGAVFLPASGRRNSGKAITDVNDKDSIWLSTSSRANTANSLTMRNDFLDVSTANFRHLGSSVRLVR